MISPSPFLLPLHPYQAKESSLLIALATGSSWAFFSTEELAVLLAGSRVLSCRISRSSLGRRRRCCSPGHHASISVVARAVLHSIRTSARATGHACRAVRLSPLTQHFTTLSGGFGPLSSCSFSANHIPQMILSLVREWRHAGACLALRETLASKCERHLPPCRPRLGRTRHVTSTRHGICFNGLSLPCTCMAATSVHRSGTSPTSSMKPMHRTAAEATLSYALLRNPFQSLLQFALNQ